MRIGGYYIEFFKSLIYFKERKVLYIIIYRKNLDLKI